MRAAHLLVLAVAVMALAVPAAANAQDPGAGDEQYQDPFGGQTQTAPREREPDPTRPPTEQQGAPLSEAAPPAAGGSGAGGAVSAPAPGAVLPRTGFDVVGVAALGVGLLLAGLALRCRAGNGL